MAGWTLSHPIEYALHLHEIILRAKRQDKRVVEPELLRQVLDAGWQVFQFEKRRSRKNNNARAAVLLRVGSSLNTLLVIFVVSLSHKKLFMIGPAGIALNPLSCQCFDAVDNRGGRVTVIGCGVIVSRGWVNWDCQNPRDDFVVVLASIPLLGLLWRDLH